MANHSAPNSFATTLDRFAYWPWWRRWFGMRSERAAARYFRKQGCRVLARNVADGKGEIDLLVLDGQTLVVVEVRSSESKDFEKLAASVDSDKQRRLTDATLRFLRRRRLLRTAVRFDVLLISWPPGHRKPSVLHYRSAFQAVGRFQMFS
jgi:putative endonuclease